MLVEPGWFSPSLAQDTLKSEHWTGMRALEFAGSDLDEWQLRAATDVGRESEQKKTDNVNPNQSSAGGTDLSVALRNFNTYQNQSLTAYSRPKL